MIKNEKLKWINVLIWLASAGSLILLMILGSKILVEDDLGLFIEFLVITIVTFIFLYLISGKKTFSYMNNQTGYTVKMLFPTLIFSIFFGILGILNLFIDEYTIIPNWPVTLLLTAANMLMVGFYEEGCFRACACDALLPLLKKTKHPFLLTAIISGLLFGYLHVVWVDFSNVQQTLQFVLKITNLLISGGTYMILYWKTRNLFGLAIVHGLNDFIPDCINHIVQFKTVDDSTSYTTGDVGTTYIYLFQLAVEVICLIYVYVKVGKTIDYKKTLEEW
ncbi:MAG: CPBP family intramembrane metalloprotease [Butyrivibrio sp.]|nr:CPBP family intramembrane metalloprotease [Butyrivibrio sp.]